MCNFNSQVIKMNKLIRASLVPYNTKVPRVVCGTPAWLGGGRLTAILLAAALVFEPALASPSVIPCSHWQGIHQGISMDPRQGQSGVAAVRFESQALAPLLAGARWNVAMGVAALVGVIGAAHLWTGVLTTSGPFSPGAQHPKWHPWFPILLKRMGFSKLKELENDLLFKTVVETAGIAGGIKAGVSLFEAWGRGRPDDRLTESVALAFSMFSRNKVAERGRLPRDFQKKALERLEPFVERQLQNPKIEMKEAHGILRLQVLADPGKPWQRNLIFEVVDSLDKEKSGAHYFPLLKTGHIPAYVVQIQLRDMQNADRLLEIIDHEVVETAWRALGYSEEEADDCARDHYRPTHGTNKSVAQAPGQPGMEHEHMDDQNIPWLPEFLNRIRAAAQAWETKRIMPQSDAFVALMHALAQEVDTVLSASRSAGPDWEKRWIKRRDSLILLGQLAEGWIDPVNAVSIQLTGFALKKGRGKQIRHWVLRMHNEEIGMAWAHAVLREDPENPRAKISFWRDGLESKREAALIQFRIGWDNPAPGEDGTGEPRKAHVDAVRADKPSTAKHAWDFRLPLPAFDKTEHRAIKNGLRWVRELSRQTARFPRAGSTPTFNPVFQWITLPDHALPSAPKASIRQMKTAA